MKRFGVMLDCSRNAVMNIEKLKYFIDCLKKIGYTTLELYTEDTYEVEGEPHFGYLRGRYTSQEIREIDKYAKEQGIELIPCIQTLAHFTAIDEVAYKDIIDNGDILLIDEPKTYEFIDKLFKTAAQNFSSRNINIGMDEAFMVGRGKYLDKFGFCDRTELLVRHLKKVAEIAKKYGFKAHMWSDMFFRLVCGGEYYESNAPISDDIKKMIPDNVELCYWDYYHTEKETYDNMLKKHKQFDCEIWFAGGAWTWNGFAPLSRFTLKTMKPAMESVAQHNIQNVLITLWGDNGAECSVFSQLHTLYAIRQYAEGNFNQESIEYGFNKIFGVKYSDFMLLDLPNLISVDAEQNTAHACCKPLLYMDPFMGFFDMSVKNRGHVDFDAYAKLLKDAGKRAGEFKYLFDELSALCLVLERKAELGIQTRTAYLSKDILKLQVLLNEYEITKKLVRQFTKKFYKLWHIENKSIGWEIHDARLGGLMQRLDTCKHRIKAYLEGKISKIEELEEAILPFGDAVNINYNSYRKLISRNLL